MPSFRHAFTRRVFARQTFARCDVSAPADAGHMPPIDFYQIVTIHKHTRERPQPQHVEAGQPLSRVTHLSATLSFETAIRCEPAESHFPGVAITPRDA